MDLKKFYDKKWRKKGDELDHSKLDLVVEKVSPNGKVLDVGGHIGILAKKIHDRGADVTLTDISRVALERAKKRGIENTVQVDLDEKPLPFEDNSFDTVISCSSIEHIFYPQGMIKESSRVLKPGGKFILLVPNIGHWRFRLWLLMGRFPYIVDTPTDEEHIRFMTVYEAKKMCSIEGLKPEALDGSAGLWVKGLYPVFFRLKYIRFFYTILARHYPSLFSRSFILVCRKQK